jgi:hypothetical protein
MNHVVINRITPVGTAITEVLYLMFQQEGSRRGNTHVTQHSERTMRVTRFKMCIDKHPGGRHFGARNAWVCETDRDVFSVYLTDYEETTELFKEHQCFEDGLEFVSGYEYQLSELYRACEDIQAFLLEEKLPCRGTHRAPEYIQKVA